VDFLPPKPALARLPKFGPRGTPGLFLGYFVHPGGHVRGEYLFITLEDLIAQHLGYVFPGMDIIEHHAFRVTRNSDLYIDEEESDNLLKKIEQSIARIDAGDYGYCDETGEAIGVGRLLARPTATLSLEAQQRRELKQKMFGD
jgi:RNA polymerase-binding transcription factor DksA